MLYFLRNTASPVALIGALAIATSSMVQVLPASAQSADAPAQVEKQKQIEDEARAASEQAQKQAEEQARQASEEAQKAAEQAAQQQQAEQQAAQKAAKEAAQQAQEQEQAQQEKQPEPAAQPEPKKPEPAPEPQSAEQAQPEQGGEQAQPEQQAQPAADAEPEAKPEQQAQPAAEPSETNQESEASANDGAVEQETKSESAEQQPAQTKAEKREQRKAERKQKRKEERAAKRKEAGEANAEQTETTEGEQSPEQASGDQPAEVSEQEAAQQAEEEAKEPASVSAEAEKPKDIAPESAEQQIEKAEKEQVVVVPDQITPQQQKALKAAEKKRRDEARERRRELIGAAAVGAVVGAVIPQLGGRVAADEGDVLVIQRDDGYYIQRDDSSLFRSPEARVTYEDLGRGRTREIIERPNGVTVYTVRDAGGYVLRRVKEYPDGQRVVLYDFRDDNRRERINYDRRLDPIRVDIPRERYIVSARRADRRLFYDTLAADPVEVTEDRYTLREIRENERLRAKVRRVDLDTINFATGSAYVSESQVAYLGDVAGAMLDVIDQDPSAVFFIEGHTDAVGSDLSNLTLSDRRAEAVGRILSDAYDVPPENLVIQGYGEEYLKVQTEGPSAANRRVTIRNISPLLAASKQ